MNIYFISPHFDDAVWSSAGRMRLFRELGYSVTVITVFSQYSSYIRPNENLAALKLLDVESICLGYKEASLRDFDGVALYAKEHELLSADINIHDIPLIKKIADDLNSLITISDLVNVPIGNSPHVDHKIVTRATANLNTKNVLWFEEFPYPLLCQYESKHYKSVEIDIDSWVNASLQYTSQIYNLFSSENIFASLLKRFSRKYIPKSEKLFFDRLWFDINNTSAYEYIFNEVVQSEYS